MPRIKKWLLFAFVLSALFSAVAHAATFTAASCNTSDVQTAINSASRGDTVMIPAGTCTWTTGVSLPGKGITIRGAGSSRIIAISQTTLTLGTGSKTLTVIGADPGKALSISAGQTLTIAETGTEGNFMTGTVTSYTPATSTLVMSITSSGGTCGGGLSNCKRWLIATPATTTLINNNATDTPLFSVTEDTLFHTNISNFTVTAGTGSAHVISISFTSGGQVVLIHDMRITGNPNNPPPPSGDSDMISVIAGRGVIWNCSFDGSPFNISTLGAIGIKDASNTTGNSWTSTSKMGSLDTTGQGKLYVEDCDFHAMGFTTSTDDNGRMAVRYCLYDNSAFGTHGADTSSYGQRYFEFYNNRMVFEGYADGTTFNINEWFFLRGGTFVIYNNTIDQLSSGDYGSKPDGSMTVMNLQRSSGPNPCWGAGTSGGARYHAPRQIGFGYVTGTGTDGLGRTNDSVTYVGDIEPAYIWGNSRVPLNFSTSDFGGTDCTAPDNSANYIVSGRDYFNGSTAKPGWSAYTYPHPLRQGGFVSPPTNLQAVAH